AQKVLAISPATAQLYTALGHPLAMTVETTDFFTAADIPGLYDRLREVNKDTLDLGRVDGGLGPNIELVFQIDPDVIVSEWAVGDVGKPAEVVAPVLTLTHLDSWKEVTRFAGELIGEEAETEALLTAYEERVQILRAQFDDPSEITISNVRLYHDRNSINLPAGFAGQILTEVGFSLPEGQLELVTDNSSYAEIEVSEERIDLIDADYLFIFGGFPNDTLVNLGTTSDTVVEAFLNDPLFNTLNVAEAGNVHEVDMHWSVTGIYSAHYLLDDLFRTVAGVDPATVAPNPLLISE
ncbi:MAG: ABC transporter substrate-binding protein, partial [Chloroflexota bacterium]